MIVSDDDRIIRTDRHFNRLSFDAELLRSLVGAGYEAPLRLLQTLPGIDLMGAAMLVVEIGSDMSVFGSAQRLASWVGMCPGNNESAGKRKSGRIRKGNAWVRPLAVRVCTGRWQESLRASKDKFQALNVRKGHKRSIMALGHKMLLDFDRADELGSIHAPVLIVGASDDAIVPVIHSHDLARRLPQARMIELQGGHFLPQTQTERYVAALEAHFVG